ncbi:DNA-binding helix-turn-helix protein [Leptospira inadai serovar Lyme str. 10]|uniref:DNA-binding helix-turn-helix protein n=2 Tax=Leptospira inadai serovar Lyme TaxID=293084 RepID=V6HA56_9LEPT|nr:DNA-binding helix-turn-helix protein [Leptospira inadai serovar Lyme str. 10]PNV76759.1 AraC family transcriptional regulator [Leptospira inadai serovar Lyme]
MLDLPTDIAFLKTVSVAQLCFLILNFLLRLKGSLQGVLGSLFCVSLIAYFICPLLDNGGLNPILFYAIHIGCFSVTTFFYLFVSSMFSDAFRLNLWHGALFIFINSLCFYIFIVLDIENDPSPISKILFSLPQLFYLGIVLFTLGRVLKDKNIDLMESRREFRVIFVWITGIYCIFVILMEVITKNLSYSAVCDFVNSFFITLLIFFFSYKLFDFRENIFLISKNQWLEEGIDENLLEKLILLMDRERIFLQENLTIANLSRKLNTHEKKVRKLINKGLGYRNFNEFLNHYRIREAAKILVDPAKQDAQVLRIAMDLGYGSLAPFNRAFKEMMGVTPSDFRRRKMTEKV